MKNAMRASVILIGATAMCSQIIYMRELLAVFCGNELSISFTLASWLAAGAIGALCHSHIIKMNGPGTGQGGRSNFFTACQILLGVLLPFGVAAARLIRPALNVNPGQLLPLFPVLAASLIVLAPVCMILGLMFSLACRKDAAYIGNVYVLEAAGSLAGGAVTGVILVRFFGSTDILTALGLLNLAAAYFLSRENGSRTVARIAAGLAVLVALAWAGGLTARLDRYSLKKEWPGYDLLAAKNSVYGNIAVVRRNGDYSFFGNGLRLFTVPDTKYSEEAVHLALLEHPDPKTVLLIGPGAGGLLEELLKEPARRIDYVELDPLIIEMAREYLPEKYCAALKNPRVSVKNTDGRAFVKSSRGAYDCIIVNAGDPYTAFVNRYYTLEFFREAKRILAPGGILSFPLVSSESYISRDLGLLLSSVYFTLGSVFDNCAVIPGDTAVFLASDKNIAFTLDAGLLDRRARERSLDARYARGYYLASRLAPEKIYCINKVLDDNRSAKMNRDLEPASYYYGLIFWTTLFRDSAFIKFLKAADARAIAWAVTVFVTAILCFTLFYRASPRKAVLTAVASGGLSTMAFQVLILLAFQATHGYLFYELGVILTAFMAGLAIGGMTGVKIIRNGVIHNSGAPLRAPYTMEHVFLMAAEGDLALFSLILPVFFMKFPVGALFPVMSVIAGFIGGFQFTVANKVLIDKGLNPEKAGGISYGADLAGSFFGALVTGAVLVPVIGIVKTSLAVAAVDLAVLVSLYFNLRIEARRHL
jgi:spermidine synthase